MHLHAHEELWMNTFYCMPPPCEGPKNMINDIPELLAQTVEQMKKYNILTGVLTEAKLDELYRWKEYDPRFKLGALVREPMAADLTRITDDLARINRNGN